MIMDYGPLPLACLAISSLLIGFSKVSVGGLVILAIPLMAIGFPGKDSTGVILPLMVLADLLAVIAYRRDCNWSVIARFFPITAVGVVIGSLIMDSIPDNVFNVVLGMIIVVMFVMGVVTEQMKMQMTKSWSYTIFVGLLVGVATMMANAAGPLLGIFFLQLGLNKAAFVGTRSWYFLLLNSFKIPFSFSMGLITPGSLALNAAFIPLLLLGAWIGIKVVRLVDETVFKRCIQTAAIIAAMHIIYIGLTR
jgi:uncharacterized protein